MKLAQALIERAELQKEIARIKSKILANIKIQEGDKPSENVDELIENYNSSMDNLYCLVVKINLTNSKVLFEDGLLMDKLCERDKLKSKITGLSEMYKTATEKVDRYSRNEVKFVNTIDSKTIGNTIDNLSKQLRELDMKIQEHNWQVELI